MSSIKQLSLLYEAVNNSNVFTNGDVINGQVVLEVTKEVTFGSLYVKCKGEGKVSWSERRNDRQYTYSAQERYFKLKQYFIQDPSKKGNEDPGVILTSGEIYSNVVKPGNHVYPFTFQIPHGIFPPSFNGTYGSVKYILEVTVDRSWKMDRTEKKEIIFAPRLSGLHLMNPQSGSIDKKMSFFTSGSTSMRATINKMGYMPGEVIKVTSEVENHSSRDLKIKYSLEQKQIFLAEGHSKHYQHTVFKIVGDPIPHGAKQTVSTDLTLPSDLVLSIANCNIMKVDYIFKVYLDVPYASDPEIKFPVIILPAGSIYSPEQNQPPFPPFGNSSAPGWHQPPLQPAFGPNPSGTNLGPAPGFYPAPYPSPMFPNPEDRPPPYAALYPNPNSTVPDFNPQYVPIGYPNPPVPQQNPVPSTSQFGPGPAEAPPEYWPAPITQPEPYPTKTPEKHD